MKHVLTKTTYLEMTSRPAIELKKQREGINVQRLFRPTVEEYLNLYNAVGHDYGWIDRNLLPRDELRGILEDDSIELFVFSVSQETAGFVELDRRQDGVIELAYFGLLPSFVGRGFGKLFLAWAVDKAWSYSPNRVWLHTCDLDHPAALPNYLKAGFKIYDQRMIKQVVD